MTSPEKTESDAATSENHPGRKGLRSRLRPLKRVFPLLVSLAVLIGLYAGALLVLRPATPGREMSLDGLVKLTLEKKVSSVQFLDEDARITGVFTDEGGSPVRFWTSYPRSDAATNDLLKTFFANNTRVDIDSQSGKALVRFVAQFLLPLVILANLFALLFYLSRSSGGGTSELLSFSKIRDGRVRTKDRSTTTFADVAGGGEAVTELAEVRDYLSDPSGFEKMGALPPKGVLLIGPPGCGKTLLARAVAGEAKAAFFSISGSEFVESLVGVGAARVRDLFRQARASAPAILFIDELDAVGRKRGAGLGGGHDEREQTLNELLVQMDGFSPTEGVAVMGATNRPDILDAALLRPGRFDRHITVERPDVDGRLAILRLHARNKRLTDSESDLPIIARRTAGFTGADLASVLNEAALLSVRERVGSIGRPQLEEAVDRVVGGPRRKAVLMSAEDKRCVAYHEAGHAVVAAALGQASAMEKVSVISRGRGIGHLTVVTDKVLPRRSDMEAQIAIAIAGIAAEELVFGEPSVGSEQDLERATNTARDMAGRYGMSIRLGRVRVLKEEKEIFLGRDYLLTRDVSQPTLEHLDAEVRRILDEEEARAKTILTSHRKVLDTMAAALMHEETLQGASLENALRGIKPYAKESSNGTPPRAPARRVTEG